MSLRLCRHCGLEMAVAFACERCQGDYCVFCHHRHQCGRPALAEALRFGWEQIGRPASPKVRLATIEPHWRAH